MEELKPFAKVTFEYSGWRYTEWFIDELLNLNPISKEIKGANIRELYLTDAESISNNMADDWESSYDPDIGFFAIDYNYDSNEESYRYDFKVVATGYNEQFQNLKKIVERAVEGEENLSTKIGDRNYMKLINLPGKNTRQINFLKLNSLDKFENVDYERLRNHLSRILRCGK